MPLLAEPDVELPAKRKCGSQSPSSRIAEQESVTFMLIDSNLGRSHVEQQGKDLALPPLWHRLRLWGGAHPWSGDFHMMRAQPNPSPANKDSVTGTQLSSACCSVTPE